MIYYMPIIHSEALSLTVWPPEMVEVAHVKGLAFLRIVVFPELQKFAKNRRSDSSGKTKGPVT